MKKKVIVSAVALTSIAVVFVGYGYFIWWPAHQVQKRIAAAQVVVQEHLNDPDSARFSQVRADDKTGAVCGFVNAKNRMGGYAGATYFVVQADQSLDFEPKKEEFGPIEKKIENATERIAFLQLVKRACPTDVAAEGSK